MAAQTAALNLAADGIADGVTALSLHTTDGSTTGTGEISGGSYTRAAVTTDFTYGAASGGTAALSGSVVFDGADAPGDTVTHLGFWAGSTWLGSAELSTPKTIGPGDTLTITAAPITVSAA